MLRDDLGTSREEQITGVEEQGRLPMGQAVAELDKHGRSALIPRTSDGNRESSQ